MSDVLWKSLHDPYPDGYQSRQVLLFDEGDYVFCQEEKEPGGTWQASVDEGYTSEDLTPTQAIEVALTILEREGLVMGKARYFHGVKQGLEPVVIMEPNAPMPGVGDEYQGEHEWKVLVIRDPRGDDHEQAI